uniref:C-type lectin domain-containing protein n=1 Tax=Oreochromis aureus TaxID=47969 RepID=A0A668RSK8_OREAU
MLRNLELKQGTVQTNVAVTEPCSTIPTTTLQPPEIIMLTQSYSTIPPTTPQPPAITTDDPCYKCEDGWKQHGGKCYFFSTSKSSWNESSTECITKGGDLVKIDSSEEQSFLRIAIQQKIEGYDDFFWIGLTDSAVEGRWLWVDGSPLNEGLTFWFSHEPDDWTGEDPGGEDCASM